MMDVTYLAVLIPVVIWDSESMMDDPLEVRPVMACMN